ncbi:unnamed protein product [Lactuca saligna]|uniref:non-specific serine/threonine protein kinase n=1 Tax=Lactuca saligna TaxID=75948 RepID=A0AA35ZP72_LACSI|nr:unnamed protein product [Lactuca saligna]
MARFWTVIQKIYVGIHMLQMKTTISGWRLVELLVRPEKILENSCLAGTTLESEKPTITSHNASASFLYDRIARWSTSSINNRRKMMVSRRNHPCHHHHRINNNPYLKKNMKRGKIHSHHGHQGGFGKVYKGKIEFGEEGIDVAIKRLNLEHSSQGATEFKAEIEMLSQFRHSHIVSLLGYHEGSDKREMIIVYEYMPNGSLEDHLHKRKVNGSNSSLLTWIQRLQICIGAARGLDYLHTGTSVQSRVIHCDIKSSNILLDENLAAKISDFGLSRIGPANQSGTTNVYTDFIKGTFGYMDAEYFATHRLTRKSDVYAFGVDLLQALCGRPALDFTLDEEQHSLAVWARDCIEEGKIDRILDPRVRGQTTASCLNEFAQIAYECMLSSSKNRPTMTKVVARLEFVLALGSQKHGGVTIAEKVWALFSIPVHAKNYRSKQKWSNDNKSKRIILGKAMTEENNNEVLKEQSSSSQMTTQKLTIFRLDELWRATGKFLPPPLLGVSDRVSVYKGWVTSASYTPSAFDVPEAIVINNLNTNVAKNSHNWQKMQTHFHGTQGLK